MSPQVFDLENHYRECFGPATGATATTTLSSYLMSIIANYTPSLLIDLSGSQHGAYIYNLHDNVVNLFIVPILRHRIGSGNYGNVYKCKRNSDSVLVKVQKTPAAGHAEPFIQWACHWILGHYGLKWAIPAVYDIVEHPSYGVIFTMEDVADGVLFGHYLNDNLDLSIMSVANDIVVLETVAQLALYILLLEKDLGLWHRDLKANNILMVRKRPIRDFEVAVDERTRLILNSSYQTIMVDFGCSSIEGLTANPMFPTVENYKDCGRDLFIIFSNIMNNFRIRQCFTEKMWGLFKRWLVYSDSTKQSNWMNVLLNDQDPYLVNAYNAVSKPTFCAPNAVPMRVIEDIAENYPSILRFLPLA